MSSPQKSEMRKAFDGGITVLVGVLVVMTLAAALMPEAQTAGDDLNATGVPLGNLFSSDGFVIVILMVSILLLTLVLVLQSKSRRGR